MKLKIAPILFLVLILFACEDKRSNAEPSKKRIEYLAGISSKKWKVTEAIAKEGTLSINLLTNQNPCLMDNIVDFNTNLTLEVTEGPTKCSPSDPDSFMKSSYKLSTDEDKLSMDKFRFGVIDVTNPTFTILKLDDLKFTGTTIIPYSGRNVELVITFTAL
ncbi:MAG: hypothetical protein ACRCVT_14990 [Leadbetterella sp.]